MHQSIRAFFIICLRLFFRFIDFIVPKDCRLIVVASKSGKLPSANTDVLWRELLGHPNYQCFRVSRGKPKDYEINLFSFQGLWKILRAKYIFLTHGPGDIIYMAYSSRKTVTYVGHGIPLKSFIYTNKSLTGKDLWLQKLETPSYDFVIASSGQDKENLKKCFAKNDHQVLVTGLPRNDLLFSESNCLSNMFPEFKRFALYAPTFRDDQDFTFFPFEDLNLDFVNDFFKSRDAVLLLRGHINSSKSLDISNFSNIIIIDQNMVPEVQEILPEVDILITDYSSIFIDYLLLERPVIFIPYDLERYKKMRGLLYEYESVTPGPYVFNQDEFLGELDLLMDSNPYLEDLKRVKKFFHKFEAGNSERLLTQILPDY